MRSRLPRMSPLGFALIALFSLVMGGYVAWAILSSQVEAIQARMDRPVPTPRPTPPPQQNCSRVCRNGSAGPPGAPGEPGQPGLNGSCGAPCSNGSNGANGADGIVQITIIGEDNTSSLVQYNTSFASVTITLSDNETFVSLPGPPGTNGTNGTDGVDGLDGLNGTCTVPCVNGTNGLDGQDGQDGLDGANGTCTSPCVNGTNGRDGSNGQNGTNGRDGTNGTCTPCVNGVNGTNGRDGVNGTNGINGVNGTNGGTGSPGQNGTCTAPCVNGTNGVDGHVFVTITGQDNDTSVVFYNTSFANLTIIISDNDTFVSLPGPQGPAGAAGANGTNGQNGANGVNGTNGVNGVNGTNGINGINGTNGVNGVNGVNGTNGINGVNGTNGVNGFNGTNGVNGVNGTNGINGVNGTCPGSCANGTTTITFNTVVYVSQNGTDAPSFGTILQPFSTIAYAMSQVDPTVDESWTIYLLGQGNIVESQNLSWKPNVNLAALSVDGIGVTFFGEAITLDFDAWNGTGTSTNTITMSNIVFFSNTTILFDFNILGYGGFPTIKFTNCQFGHPGDGQTTRIVAHISGNAQPTLYTTNIIGNNMYLKDTPIHSVGDRLDYLQMVADSYDSYGSILGSSVDGMEILSDDDDWQYSMIVRGSSIGGVILDGSHSHLSVDSASLSYGPPLIQNNSILTIVDRFFQQIQLESEPQNMDPTAIFRADSTTQLLYIPAMTTSEKEAITPSRAGAMVFDTTLGTGSLWNGTAWNSFG